MVKCSRETDSAGTFTKAVGWVALVGVLVWAYGSSMADLAQRWWNEPDYLHGFLVVPFAVFLLWHRREMVDSFTPRGSWWGIAFLAVSAVMWWGYAYFYFKLLKPLSLIPCLAGIILFVGGWRALRWAWPAVLFLVFMIPIPGIAANVLGQTLQRIGTTASTYALQTLGIPAVARGNVILLTEATLGVADVCSGLRMMTLFVAVCVGAAFLMRRPLAEKVVVVLSAAPIAVVANVIRITVTGICYEFSSPELAEAVYHNLAGWFMMPLAVLLLWAEIALLSKLFPTSGSESGAPAVQEDTD
jgi:exosortase